METNEIMENEEVVETAEELVEAGSGKNLKVVAGVGLAAIVGVIAYKYVAKPMIAKIKEKKKLNLYMDENESEDTQVEDEEEFEKAN